MLRAMGVDVSVARSLDIVLLSESLMVEAAFQRKTPDDLPALIQEWQPDIIAIDSPAKFPAHARRQTEAFVNSLGMSLYTTPWDAAAQASSFYDWMRVGISVFQQSEASGYPLFSGANYSRSAVEVFPDACAVVLDGRIRPSDIRKEVWRRSIVAHQGIDVRLLKTPDQIDAALAALTGIFALTNRACWRGDPLEGVIVLPCLEADLPTTFRPSSRAVKVEGITSSKGVPSMPNQHINPAGVSAPTGYTHVVSGQGRMVFISGQVAANAKGDIVGEGDFAKQATQVFENLKTCLTAAGASFDDVVKLTTYVVNYSQDVRPLLQAARAAYLPKEPPASTLVGVQALARPEYMLEIEAVAIVGS